MCVRSVPLLCSVSALAGRCVRVGGWISTSLCFSCGSGSFSGPFLFSPLTIFLALPLPRSCCTPTVQSLFLFPTTCALLQRVLTGMTGSRLWLRAGGGGAARKPAAEHNPPPPVQHLQACQAPRDSAHSSKGGGGTWRKGLVPGNGQEMWLFEDVKGVEVLGNQALSGAVVSIIRADPAPWMASFFLSLSIPRGSLLWCGPQDL